jgi:nitrate reductase assembly molybdenum cofactor insertion protein NarJ
MSVFQKLAAALTYPDRPEIRMELQSFPGFSQLNVAELEELYTRTFDINPVCSLEAGWHLFGEDYNRGAFLVRMRDLLRQHNVPEGAELPDHLPNALRVLEVMPHEDAAELAREFIMTAVGRMRVPFEDSVNLYGPILLEVENFLRELYGTPLSWTTPTDTTPYVSGGCGGVC